MRLWRKYGFKPIDESEIAQEHWLVGLLLEARPELQKPFLARDLRYNDVLDLIEALAERQ